MKVIIVIDSNKIVDRLVTSSIIRGFRREEPNKSWSDKERREAIVYLIKKTFDI